MKRQTNVDLHDLADYEGTPWLTALANFCLVVGVCVGVYAVIFLAGYLYRGLAFYWPLILILALDIAVNLALQVARLRRRRALGLTRSERRRRVGLDRDSRR